MGLDLLQAAELRTGNKTLMNHRKHGHMRLEAAGGVLVYTRYKTQERRLSSTVMTNQGHTSTLANGQGNILQGRNTAPPRLRLRRPPVTDRISVDFSERFCGEGILNQHSLVQERAGGLER